MDRFFNTAGPCRADLHFMLPPEARIPEVRHLMEKQTYFVVHAPRQVGKTTSFIHLARQLTGEGRYSALMATCETGQTARDNLRAADMAVIHSIEANAEQHLPKELRPPQVDHDRVEPGNRIAHLLRRWAQACPRPVVLFLDEIDAMMGQGLISVLRQIRSRYENRPRGFPQSVALIGLRDVRDYRTRYRKEHASMGTASPFNIKVESLTIRDFSAGEVADLYRQHTEETGQAFSDEAVAMAYDMTMGQPWLVNALAYQVTWRDLRDRAVAITAEHVEAAKEALIERQDTHLGSLVDKLREERVRRVIEPILAGSALDHSVSTDDIRYVEDLGLISSHRQIRVANPIYQEIIPRALAWTTQVRLAQEAAWYTGADGRLDMRKLLAAFADFWKEHAEPMLAAQPYHEAAPHLALLAFLQRIINGGGFIHREYAVGMGRMDLLVRWPFEDAGGERAWQREALEIKVWRDRRADPVDAGLDQLTGYVERLGLKEGYLVIFDRRADAPPPHERTSITEVRHRELTVVVLRA